VRGSGYLFVIPGTLPGLNAIIASAKEHWAAYRKMKETATQKVVVALINSNVPKMGKVQLDIEWFEPNKKRDKDNAMAGVKFIWDGLVAKGIILNDTWRYQGDTKHHFEVDRDNPRIEVIVTEEV